jgi:hypothetical protein
MRTPACAATSVRSLAPRHGRNFGAATCGSALLRGSGRRPARAGPPRSMRLARAWPGRCGTMPCPTSRRVASRAAAPVQARNRATARPSSHQWSPPDGRICWPQPIGDSQAGQALSTRRPLGSRWPAMLPTPLVRNATPSTAAGQAAGGTGAGGQLGGDRGHADERDADDGDRAPGGERAAARLPGCGHPIVRPAKRELGGPRLDVHPELRRRQGGGRQVLFWLR